MVLPNLLIAGVAKSGTSSLHKYLDQHPQVFMSSPKEPRFLSSQVMKFPMGGPKDHKVESWYIKDFASYSSIFEGVTDEKIIGESSADTFYFHEKTIPVIKKYLGDPKIIIILRNPVKRAFSAYQHLRRDSREAHTFEEGLELEQQRIKDNYELIYHYRAVSHYSTGLEQFYKNFSQVKVILNEELQKHPERVLKEVFTFLGVDDSVTVESSVKHNASGIPKSKWLHAALFEGKDIFGRFKPVVRFFIPSKARKSLSRKLMETNLSRIDIAEDTYQMLEDEFREEVRKIADLTGLDLSSWGIKY